MYVKDAVAKHFDELCRELHIDVIKKLCDGLEISLAEFFSGPIFDELEQEIR